MSGPTTNAAEDMLEPIIAPAPMNQDLGDWQKLLKKGEDYQAKMASEQAKPQPNQNKLNNWQAQANQTVAQIDQVVPRIENRINQMDTARPALRSELNSVAQDSSFSSDSYADQLVNPFGLAKNFLKKHPNFLPLRHWPRLDQAGPD